MITFILSNISQILTLAFGIFVTILFAGVPFSKNTIKTSLVLLLICGIFEFTSYIHIGEQGAAIVHPLIVHIPVGAVIFHFFKKKFLTIVAAICTAMMFCEPSEWFGLLFSSITSNVNVGLWVKIAVIIIMGYICITFLSRPMSVIFNKSNFTVFIFSIVPLGYYIFDYTMYIISPIKELSSFLAVEFLTFFLCMAFTILCCAYYYENERRHTTEYKSQVVRIVSQEQAKEINAMNTSAHEMRLLRHDMRLILETIALSIENGDKETALDLISKYSKKVENTAILKFCNNNTLNYIFNNFKNQCEDAEINYNIDIELDDISFDEISFAAILSNALDNAIFAQKELPKEKKFINVFLKETDGKCLLSIKNSLNKPPLFKDGYPISTREGHGYGTQSIRYITEKLGGRYQFGIEDNMFTLRVII